MEFTDNERHVRAHWPPKGLPLPIVSVDQESREHFGLTEPPRNVQQTEQHLSSPSEVVKGVVSGWPQPFYELFPPGTGLDIVLAWAEMRRIALLSEADVEAALNDAKVKSAQYLEEGTSTWEAAHFWPTFAKEGQDGAAIAGSVHFGLDEDDFFELLNSDRWQSVARTPLPILRAWGGVGLMWALLLERLQARRPFGRCQACGNLISRAHGRRCCNRQENAACVKQRQRSRQARRRSRTPR